MKTAHIILMSISTLIFSSSLFANQKLINLELMWQKNKDKPEYGMYLDYFIQNNNKLKLDTKDGCFAMASGELVMYITVNAQGKIESVVTNLTNSKSKCFKQTYIGLSVKPPPFSPFVIQMVMQDSQ